MLKLSHWRVKRELKKYIQTKNCSIQPQNNCLRKAFWYWSNALFFWWNNFVISCAIWAAKKEKISGMMLESNMHAIWVINEQTIVILYMYALPSFHSHFILFYFLFFSPQAHTKWQSICYSRYFYTFSIFEQLKKKISEAKKKMFVFYLNKIYMFSFIASFSLPLTLSLLHSFSSASFKYFDFYFCRFFFCFLLKIMYIYIYVCLFLLLPLMWSSSNMILDFFLLFYALDNVLLCHEMKTSKLHIDEMVKSYNFYRQNNFFRSILNISECKTWHLLIFFSFIPFHLDLFNFFQFFPPLVSHEWNHNTNLMVCSKKKPTI